MGKFWTSIRSLLWGSRLRRILSSIAAVIVALVLITLAVVEWWLIPKAAKRVAHELARNGFHISYRDPDLSLWRGSLSLKDITLYRTAAKREPLLFVSNLGVRVDLGELIWRQALWGEGEILDGELIVYGRRENTVLKGLDVAFDVDKSRMRINRFAGDGNFGYRLQLAGVVRWAADGAAEAPAAEPAAEPAASPGEGTGGSSTPSPAAEPDVAGEGFPDFPADFAWLEDLVEIFRCEARGEALPVADLELIWDETRPLKRRADGSTLPLHQLVVRGTIGGSEVVWKDLPLDSYAAAFELEDWRVLLPSMEFRGLRGAVTGSGVYQLDTHRLDLRGVRSDADAVAVLERLGAAAVGGLSNIEYDVPPVLSSDRLVIDFRDLAASDLGFAIEAKDGLRYRDDGEVLEIDTLVGSVDFRGQGRLLFENIEAKINGLQVAGRVALQGAAEPESESPAAPGDAEPPAEPVGSESLSDPAPAPAGAVAASAEEAEADGPLSLVSLLNNLLRLESGGDEAPSLYLDVEFDPKRGLEGLGLNGSFRGAGFAWNGRKIELAEFDIACVGGEIELEKMRFVGLGGTFQGRGSYHVGRRIISVPELRSTIDLATFREEIGIELPEQIGSIDFPAPPRLDVIDLQVELGDAVLGRGSVEFSAGEGFTLSDGEDAITATRFDLAMAWTEPEVLKVKRASGRFGDLEFDVGGEFSWDKRAPADPAPGGEVGATGTEAASVIAPAPAAEPVSNPAEEPAQDEELSLVGLLKDYLTVESKDEPVSVVGEFRWDGRLRGEAEREWYEQLEFEADITGQDYTWREFAVVGSRGKMALMDAALRFGPFELKTTEGSIESRASYAIESNQLRMETLRLTIDPLVVIDRLGIPLDGPKGRVDFLGQPVIVGKDVLVDFADPTASKGSLDLRTAEGIVLVTPKGREALLSNVAGTFSFGGGVIEAQNLTADILEGKASLGLKFVRDPEVPSFEVEVGIAEISIAALNDWIDPDNQVIERGVFDLSFKGEGTNSVESLKGGGRATVGSDVPAAGDFPIISGLVGMLEVSFPILRRDRSWELDLPFTVAEGKISTTNTRLTSRRVSATIRGHVDWMNGRVDLLAGVNVRGLLGIVTNVARPFRSGFVEVVGRGPVDNVRWGLAATQGRRAEEEPRRSILPRAFRGR